ncbi:MAG: LamG-like jellyroll fold domain-containing protein, partial [Bacteroidota bacterium]
MLTAIGNSAANQMLFRANTFLADSAAFTVGYNDSTSPFLLGAANTSAGFQMDTGGNLQSNLIAYWKLEEASGTRLDATGRGNNLTDNNTVTQVLGRVDSAASFLRANSESLSIADNADMSVSDSNFTFASWVFMTDAIQTGQTRAILSKDFSTTSREYLMYATTSFFRFLVFGSPTGSLEVETGGFGVNTTSRWLFLVAWHDSANNTLNLQVDNASINSADMGTVAPFDGSAEFRIGGRQDADQVFWDGRIDEVGFWKRVLTANERTDLYKSSSGNRYSTDYADGAVDETGFWRKALSNTEIISLVNSGNANTYR